VKKKGTGCSSSLRRGPTALVLCALLSTSLSCTDTYLEDPRNQSEVPADRTVAVEGEFCTPSPNEVVRPIKIALLMDASQSMRVTDPMGQRALAMIDLMANLPQDPEIYITVLTFAGSTSGWLIANSMNQQLPEFHQLAPHCSVSLSKACTPATVATDCPPNETCDPGVSPQERLNVAQRLLNFSTSGGAMTGNPNRDSTDFVKPLADIYSLIAKDIGDTRAQLGMETRARYSVIFLSDGHPTNNQDDELLCMDAVTRIRQLKDLADDVRVNTVHVFNPVAPVLSTVCNLDGGMVSTGGSSCRLPVLPPGACPLLIVNQDAERLEKMAELGGGDFRDFRNGEPINFLNFRFGQVRHTFTVDQVVASNFSAPPGSDPLMADTDGDGLLDVDEAKEMTNPWVKDTDGDGFNDGVEVYFRQRACPNGPMGCMSFIPNQVALPDGGGLDFGCPPSLRGVDTDCDGLSDCDEQLIGTNSLKVDSDDDGIPDAVEWQHHTSPSNKDLGQDPDNDNVSNGDELKLHTDPLKLDTSKLTTVGYRYDVQRDGNVNDAGRQCYKLRIDNISLANTLPDTRDAGNPDGGAPLYRRGAGYNDIYVSFASLPGDDPNGHTLVWQYHFNQVRFPVGGIKSPPDGVIHVEPSDFVDRCGGSTTP
jgi:hypothetical protein